MICFSVAKSQPVNNFIKEGNEFYRLQQFVAAATSYNNAIANDPQNTTAKFNLANTLVKQGKETEAMKIYAEIAADSKGAELKSKAYYNKGAVLSKQKKLEESIEAYKDALRNNPNDKEARENLQKALLELKKKNPPQNKDEQKKKQQQNKQQKPKISQKEAEQRLKLLEQKEKEVQQRLQKQKATGSGSLPKDW